MIFFFNKKKTNPAVKNVSTKIWERSKMLYGVIIPFFFTLEEFLPILFLKFFLKIIYY